MASGASVSRNNQSLNSAPLTGSRVSAQPLVESGGYDWLAPAEFSDWLSPHTDFRFGDWLG